MTDRVKELLKALKDKGYNQRKVAEKIGVTEAAVSGWASGRRNITDQSIRAICREYNVNEQWVRFGTGEMFADASDDDFLKAASTLSNDPFVRSIIIEYYKLDDDSRRLLREFIGKLSINEEAQSSKTKTFEEMSALEIAEQVEIEREKEKREKSDPSSSTA